MPLQLKSGHLAYTATNHLAMCAAACPGLADVDWYLYLCDPGLPSSWCPTAGFITTAINLGTLVLGSQDISLSSFSCTSQNFQLFCNSPTDDDSCTRDLDFTNVKVTLIVSAISGGYEFDIDMIADVDTTDCSSSAFSHTLTLLTSNGFGSGVAAAPSTCENGIYAAGAYSHRNLSVTAFNCDGAGATGSQGVFLDPNKIFIGDGAFFVAPLASVPSCPP